MPPGEERWDVFLAHASPDKPRARILYRALVDLGVRVFLDEESLLPGDDWMDDIPAAVRASDVVAVLVSGSGGYYDGEEVVISIAEVRGGRQRVVPIHLAPDLDNPYGLARKNRIDWHDEADVDGVVARLRRVIPRAVRGETIGASVFSHRIPVPPRHFTGRDELLERLTARLAAGGTTTLTQTIQGMGGVGKTTVAAALCEAQRELHDIVWWVRAEDPGTLVTDLADLAGEVGAETGEGGDADANAVVRWLETTDRRWLVVFDNVPDRDSIVAWLPRRGSGAAILTSRYKHMRELGNVEPVDLLPDDVAEAFLRDRVSRPIDEDLGPVLERVLGLPLALEQAGAWVDRKPNRTFARWVELYDEAAEEAFALGLVDYEHTAASTWRVSIDAATEESPLAERLLGALGHFAPEGIVIQWLRDAADDPYLDATPAEVDAAIDALDSYDLVTINPDDTVDIHRIIHDTARAAAPDEACSFAVDAIERQDPGRYEHKDWRTLAALGPHARFAARVVIDDARSAPNGLVYLIARISILAADEGQTREALDAANVAIDLARATAGGTAVSLIAEDALARAKWAVGDFDGLVPILQRVLEDSERILGPDHRDTLVSRNNLATAYRATGHASLAVPILERLQADLQRVFGPEHPETLVSLSNLGNALHDSGSPERAVPIHEMVLADRERLLGPDHEDTLASRNNLASAILEAGDPHRAISLHEAVLADQARVLGRLHPATLASQNNLAMAYWRARDPQQAAIHFAAALEGYERVFGSIHPRTETIRRNLAAVRRRLKPRRD